MSHNKELQLHFSDTEWPFDYIDHTRLIVRAIVVDESGLFYFVRVQRNDMFGPATLIETSGGGVESNEDLISALKRELHEELGATVSVVSKLGVVSDYYNLLHRHNENHYYLCRALSFGSNHLTQDEVNCYHLSTLKMSYAEALNEYAACTSSKLGRLIARREIPVLHHAKEILDSIRQDP